MQFTKTGDRLRHDSIFLGVAQGTFALSNNQAGITLIDTTPNPDRILDSVGYEGLAGGAAETAAAPTDNGAEIIVRCPNGTDTGNNSADFLARIINPGVIDPTPGAANDCP